MTLLSYTLTDIELYFEYNTDRIGLEDGRPDMEIPTYSGGLGPLARAVFERVSEIQEGKVPGHQWIVEI
jgi:branched-chain amino acid aminotransferase